MIGGIPRNYSYSFKIPQGNYFVIEGDEYDTAFFDKVPKFIHYKPKSVILTSVEFDHADIYKDLDHVKESFLRLMSLIPADGNLIYWNEGEHVVDVVKSATCKNIFSYGIESGDFQAKNIRYTEESCDFDVFFKGQKLTIASLKVFGKHNILNALSTFALSYALKLPQEKVLSALKTFEGVKRRQEIIGKPHGITLIEDFAHHPTAVDVSIESIKDRYKNKKVVALFEPRSATSRRNIFQKDYVNAFKKADITILADVFNAGTLKEEERLSTQTIVSELKKNGKDAYGFATTDEIVACVKQKTQPGDVVVIMSNGSFGGIYQKLLSAL
jgi:UDP-N-acetylmuramate: L-alanyl-gamma-D-glutamyl-meso-diaminopimelate ligase